MCVGVRSVCVDGGAWLCFGVLIIEVCFGGIGKRGVFCSTKEYKRRTDSNSPTEPNEAVCSATLLLL